MNTPAPSLPLVVGDDDDGVDDDSGDSFSPVEIVGISIASLIGLAMLGGGVHFGFRVCDIHIHRQ